MQFERRLAQEKAAMTNNPEDWKLFRSLRNKTTASIRKDKKSWEEQKFSQVNNTSTDMWRSVKDWLIGTI